MVAPPSYWHDVLTNRNTRSTRI
uniref:Uncharacterized protein n=3 Tax=Timema TaxID=61471 RepID=A0A7R9HGP7_TIMPO|nr:unnamed protein product [Timema douglasi]CAD7420615.1 unnamed protein product [Timema poppensis]CAD7581652.1 unnamed protein product [Timema californicum]